jgi:hypothetical protein
MLRESKKLILYNIDWMIQHGMVEENAEATEIFHEMEKNVQKCKLKLQETILLEKNKGRHLGKLEFAAYDGKKKTRAMTKGICQLGLPSLGINVHTILFNQICSIKLQQEFVQ